MHSFYKSVFLNSKRIFYCIKQAIQWCMLDVCTSTNNLSLKDLTSLLAGDQELELVVVCRFYPRPNAFIKSDMRLNQNEYNTSKVYLILLMKKCYVKLQGSANVKHNDSMSYEESLTDYSASKRCPAISASAQVECWTWINNTFWQIYIAFSLVGNGHR